ncbi:MAG: zf-HC2 domain-containing protein [Candidatus Sulfopaludibacter sp.]|nr:zf-HC2 domain-containing protein [Candidatus Sulfopaludibacter sp.]
MKHEFAVTTNAVERYLIGDMPAEERDAFEEHYFSCEDCAEDLRIASCFIENAKTVWRDEAQKPPGLSFLDWMRAKWLSPAVAAVATAALAVVVFQNTVTIPALNAPRALPALALDLTSRAAVQRLSPADPLHFQIAGERPANSAEVMAELSAESGRVLRRGVVPAPGAQQPIDVYFPGTLKPARYIITVRSFRNGRPEEQIARTVFEVTTVQEHTN